MIASAELKRSAGHSGIHYGVLERDYCLGWMLYGISRERKLYHGMVFKGGTALKKCYFGEFRFSQDLDYTCRKELPAPELETLIQNACRNAAHMSGIEFKLAEFQKSRSVEGEEAFVAKIDCRGPSNPKTMLPRIQMDLTYYEDIVLEPEDRPIIHRSFGSRLEMLPLGRYTAPMVVRRFLALTWAVALVGVSLNPVAAAANKKKKQKAYDYENSKYKAYKELVGEPRTYRFDERGNPIQPDDKKKSSSSRKKGRKPQAVEPPKSCGAGESCQDEQAAQPESGQAKEEAKASASESPSEP